MLARLVIGQNPLRRSALSSALPKIAKPQRLERSAALGGITGLTPLAKAFLAIGGAICGEDFAQGGRTLETLGLGNLGKAEFQALLRRGF